MPGDLLESGEPKRLVCHDGRWFLEVVRLVAIETNLFQPHVQRLEGADAVLGFLKKSARGGSLLSGTQQLLRSPTLQESRSFENVDGEWIPSAISPSYIKQLTHGGKRTDDPEGREEVQALQSELLLLRASHQRLKERVLELEKSLTKLNVPALLPGAMAQGDVRIDHTGDAMVGGNRTVGGQPPELQQVGALGAMPREPDPTDPTHSTAAAATPARSVRAEPAPDKKQARRHDKSSALQIPPIEQLVRSLHTLLGTQVEIRKVPLTVDYTRELENYWMAKLNTDDNAPLGVILANLDAVVQLGGELMMLPDAELQHQLSQQEASEDAVAAMSEVCNALSGTFSEHPGNARVRSTYLERHELDNALWLKGATDVVQLEVGSGGLVLLVMRKI